MGLGFSHILFTHKASILNLFLLKPLKMRLTCFPESNVIPCLYTKALYWPNKLTHNAVSSKRRERKSILAWLFWHHIGFPHSREPGLHKLKVQIPLCWLVKDSAAGVRDLDMEVTKLMYYVLLLVFTHCMTTKLISIAINDSKIQL